jgi:undecaprenyl diphosphate synthase
MQLRHLAIILDGNRRWARERGFPTLEGHRRGYENMRRVALAAFERGIEHLTVFAFSTENWKRSKQEVAYLLRLLHRALTLEMSFFEQHDIRLRVLGGRQGLSERLVRAMEEAERRTANHTSGQLNVCINYGGRAEIVDAVRRLVEQGMEVKEIGEETFRGFLWTADVPDPDLIVRTSGEQRLSGFLTWASVYAELLFLDKHWPDFSPDDLNGVIKEFEKRKRRFGV